MKDWLELELFELLDEPNALVLGRHSDEVIQRAQVLLFAVALLTFNISHADALI
jgi:hypothetical protein